MSILNYISDSIAHLVDGLEKLTDNLLEEGVTAFQAVGRYIVDSWGGDPDLLRLLLRKGVFPYTYLTSIDRLEETKLPPKRNAVTVIILMLRRCFENSVCESCEIIQTYMSCQMYYY